MRVVEATGDPTDPATSVWIGRLVDEQVVALMGPRRRAALRGLSLQDHPGLDAQELAELIERTGTDRYDPARRPVLADLYDPLGVQVHAVPCHLKPGGQLAAAHYPGIPVTAGIVADFARGPLADRNSPPLHVDLVTVYDPDRLEPISVQYGGRAEREPTAFRFANGAPDGAAVLGVLVIDYGADRAATDRC